MFENVPGQFYAVQEEKIAAAEEKIGRRFPAPLLRFYRERGYGFVKNDLNAVNRLMDPDSCASLRLREGYYGNDPDMEMYEKSEENALLFFEVEDQTFMSIGFRDGKIYCCSDVIADDLAEFLEKIAADPDYWSELVPYDEEDDEDEDWDEEDEDWDDEDDEDDEDKVYHPFHPIPIFGCPVEPADCVLYHSRDISRKDLAPAARAYMSWLADCKDEIVAYFRAHLDEELPEGWYETIRVRNAEVTFQPTQDFDAVDFGAIIQFTVESIIPDHDIEFTLEQYTIVQDALLG